MSWKGFFEGIQEITEEVAFAPFDALRRMELESWWASNMVSWILVLIGFVAFFYWMNELAKYNANNEEDRSQVAHAYLGEDSPEE